MCLDNEWNKCGEATDCPNDAGRHGKEPDLSLVVERARGIKSSYLKETIFFSVPVYST